MVRIQILQLLRVVLLFKWNSTATVESLHGNKWDENSQISHKFIKHNSKSLWDFIHNDNSSLEFAL